MKKQQITTEHQRVASLSQSPLAAWQVLFPRLSIAAVLALTLLLAGCTTPGLAPGASQASPISLEELPPAARFVEIGNIGQAYRLDTTHPTNARFPVSRDGVASLLPATIRLFHFDEQRAVWTEIDDSRFNGKNRQLAGSNLAPGYYTAFGWSANPVENILQRLNLDAQRGFHPEQAVFGSLDELKQSVLSAPTLQKRSILVLDFIAAALTVPIRQCFVFNPPGSTCPAGCASSSSHDSNQCPVMCPEDSGCCRCVEQRMTLPPVSVFDPPWIERCRTLPCGVCPYGLSCPNGQPPFPEVIRPDLSREFEIPVEVIPYFRRIGLNPIVTDPIFREPFFNGIDQLHNFQDRWRGDPNPQLNSF